MDARQNAVAEIKRLRFSGIVRRLHLRLHAFASVVEAGEGDRADRDLPNSGSCSTALCSQRTLQRSLFWPCTAHPLNWMTLLA